MNQPTIERAESLAVPEIPALTGVQRQGDVLIVPGEARLTKAQAVDAEGVAVLSGHHNHVLVADGAGVTWQRSFNKAHEIGAFSVAPGSVAFLFHDDHHDPLAFGPGTYVCRRQRELAGGKHASRFVED